MWSILEYLPSRSVCSHCYNRTTADPPKIRHGVIVQRRMQGCTAQAPRGCIDLGDVATPRPAHTHPHYRTHWPLGVTQFKTSHTKTTLPRLQISCLVPSHNKLWRPIKTTINTSELLNHSFQYIYYLFIINSFIYSSTRGIFTNMETFKFFFQERKLEWIIQGKICWGSALRRDIVGHPGKYNEFIMHFNYYLEIAFPKICEKIKIKKEGKAEMSKRTF